MKKIHSLIIGGTHGIGKSLVEAWAMQPGHMLSVGGRKGPMGKDRHFLDVERFQLDLGRPREIKPSLNQIIRRRGKVNNLVFFQRYRDGKDSWMGELEIGLMATKVIIETLQKSFVSTGEMSIVIVGSMADRLVADDCSAGYHVAKAGLRQLARYYAVNLGGQGIRVNCVTPGELIKDESAAYFARNKILLEGYKKMIPLKRMGSTNDIIQAIEFLCSTKASFITGQNLVVDGGLSLRWQGSLAKKAANS